MALIESLLRDTMQKLVKAPGLDNSHFFAQLGRAILLIGLQWSTLAHCVKSLLYKLTYRVPGFSVQSSLKGTCLMTDSASVVGPQLKTMGASGAVSRY